MAVEVRFPELESAGCLLELYDLHAIDDPFSVGFVFSDAVEAESEHSPEYGQVYYLNPCRVTRRGHTRRFTRASRHRVLAAAAHEFVHGALNESYHGEDYAARLTEVMATTAKTITSIGIGRTRPSSTSLCTRGATASRTGTR